MMNFKSLSDDISIEFGLDKSVKTTFKREKFISSKNIILYADMWLRDTTKKVLTSILVWMKAIEYDIRKGKKIWKVCIRRVQVITKTELNSKNIIMAINNFAVNYRFNIIYWDLTKL